jgi:uncharacterized membrane protein (Fun14 family)
MKKIGKVVLVVAGTGVLATQVLANQGTRTKRDSRNIRRLTILVGLQE